jgi:hypothetical protein
MADGARGAMNRSRRRRAGPVPRSRAADRASDTPPDGIREHWLENFQAGGAFHGNFQIGESAFFTVERSLERGPQAVPSGTGRQLEGESGYRRDQGPKAGGQRRFDPRQADPSELDGPQPFIKPRSVLQDNGFSAAESVTGFP